MPLLVSCEELQPGMKLCEALISNGRVMLQGGKRLTRADITVIQRRYPGLRFRVSDHILDGAVDFEDDSHEREVAAQTQRKVSSVVSDVGDRFAQRSSLGEAECAAFRSAVKELMAYLKANPVSAALITNCLDGDSYLSAHTGNVFYLSMLLGSTVVDYVVDERNRQTWAGSLQASFATDLTPLGLGTMVMDLGMIPLQHLFKEDNPLTDADRQALREHPVLGAQMLPDSFSSGAKMIVRTHHENLDGTGYPAGMAGDKIHVFTRIVRIADAYDAATSDRAYRGAKSSPRVLWEMTAGPYSRFYDPTLMKAFARLIQPFPIGSKLRLEDGRYAAVVKYNRSNPFLPTVVIAFDCRERPIPRRELEDPVDLSEPNDLRIKSFRGEDLSFIYAADPPEHACVREKFVALLDAAYP